MRRHSSLTKRHNLPKRHTFQVAGRLRVQHMSGVPSMSPGVQGLCWRLLPEWWHVEEGEVAGEEDWCRHTGGTGTVAGTVDTVGIDAFAGSTLCKT